MARGHASLQAFALPNSEWAARGFGVKSNGELRTAATMLTVPNAQLADIEAAMEEAPQGWRKAGPPDPAGGPPIPLLGREAVEISVKYASYLERQAKEVARMESHQGAPIPPGTDFASIPCLSREEVDKLTAAQPATLADAATISGITPNALRYVLAHVGGRKGAAAGRRAQGKEAAARGAEGKDADA